MDEQKQSPAVTVLVNAQTQVDEVLAKAEQTFKLLQQNIEQVATQRTVLQQQKKMLGELIIKITQAEKQS